MKITQFLQQYYNNKFLEEGIISPQDLLSDILFSDEFTVKVREYNEYVVYQII